MFKKPYKGVWSNVPSDKWQDGYLVGNGETGGILFGTSFDYNLIINHHSLYLKTSQMEHIPDMSDCLKELRHIIREKGYQKGIEFFEKKAVDRGYEGLTMSDLYHPGAQLVFKIESLPSSQELNYLRALDYEKGVVLESFSAESGQHFYKKLFASKKYDKIFFELESDDQFSVQFSLKNFNQPGLSQKSKLIDDKRLEQVCTYSDNSNYKVTVEWETDGEIRSLNSVISIEQATRLRLAISVNDSKQTDLKAFEAILKDHMNEHSHRYNQVSLDISEVKEREKSYETLIDGLGSKEEIPVILYEKLYDASRYFIQSMSGPALPNLQGIWSGDFSPPWSGDFTFDTNVQLAIASLASLGLFENFSGLFNTVKAYEKDFRENAQNYFGCRGFLVPVHASTRALHVHWNKEWPLIFWTAGAGWLAYFYNEYYDYTQDKRFLKEVAIPFYKETLLFYEDFVGDESEKALFRPSYSAENGMGDNSTMDIAVVKAAITYLKNAYADLGIDLPGKYNAFESRLPEYMIDEEGVLKEWIDESVEENPNHRHFSNLYPVFQSKEITEKQAELWDASHKAFDKRLEAWLLSEDGDTSSSHGRMHAAMCAIALERPQDFEKAIRELIRNQSFFPSFAASHYNHQNVFNVDANGSYPKVVHDALLYSENLESLTLFKAVPSWLKKGTLKGIRLPNSIKVSQFTWDLDNYTFTLELVSEKTIDLILHLPESKRFEETDCRVLSVELKKQQPLVISKRLTSPGAE